MSGAVAHDQRSSRVMVGKNPSSDLWRVVNFLSDISLFMMISMPVAGSPIALWYMLDCWHKFRHGKIV